MPATAGRVRMPANNRVHSSAALQTHGIWQCAIGYDPYAPDRKDAAAGDVGAPASAGGENAYDSFQGLLQLAKIQSNPSTDEVRGACRRCNKVGHLSFQCRNLMKTTEDAGAVAEIKRQRLEKVAEFDEGSDSDDESDSDSDVDSEMERAIAERDGRKGKGSSARDTRRSSSSSRDVKKSKSHHRSSKKSKSRSYSDEECSSDSGEKRKSKKSHSKKSKSRRSHSEEDDSLSSDDYDGDRKHRSTKHHRHRKSSKRSTHRAATSDASDDSRDRRRDKKRKLRKTD